jgi:nitronate monooxygenase
MPRHLRDLLDVPVIQAPMAGGPGTVDLAAAVCNAGALGFLAGGYRVAADLASDIEALRRLVTGPFGVNLFVPRRDPADTAALERYLEEIAPDAARAGVELGAAEWDDDDWTAKADLLVEARVPLVSFTFACPPEPVTRALQAAGSLVMVTVTSPEEAVLARDAGADALGAQGTSAGGHRGSFTDAGGPPGLDTVDLVRAVRDVVDLPVVGAGGLMTGQDLADVVAAGAVGGQLGTAFLRCPESGTTEVHRRALVDPQFDRTAFTRSFSGRTARGLVNRFMSDHPDAPVAYPHINNATKPFRRAAAANGDPDRVNLWAGSNFHEATSDPAAAVVGRLVAEFAEHARPGRA